MKIIVAMKDLAIQAFTTPFTVHARGEAIRSLRDEVARTDQKSAIAAHPEDYELYQLATYDEATGKIEGQEPELIVRAKDLLNQGV